MLSPSEISYIGELARLSLAPDEEAELGRDLARILDYIDHLKAFGGDAPETSASASGAAARLRGDRERPGLAIDEFLDNAPKRLDRFLVVPVIK